MDEMAKLHAIMDGEEESRKYRLRAAVLKKNTNELLQHITAAVEAAFVRYLELKGKDAVKESKEEVRLISKARRSHCA